MKKEEKTFLKAKDLANILQCTVATVIRLTKNGSLRGVKIGKKWYYEDGKFLVPGKDYMEE